MAQRAKTVANNGTAVPTRRRKWRQLEECIERLKTQLANGHRNVLQYWNAITHTIKDF